MYRLDGLGKMEDPASAKHRFEGLGPFTVALALLVVLRIAFTVFGLPHPGVLAIIGTVLVMAAWFVLSRRRRQKKIEKAVALRKQLSALEEQEFALRYKVAEMDGQLDRWKKKS